MAEREDYLIDGKSIFSLRVVDLKQELKKKDIQFKTNATKAQLQTLLIDHLKQSIDVIEDKSSEENSRTTTQSDDTNETIESNNETNNVETIEDNTQQTKHVTEEATDLSQDTAITSSVSFGDRNSIKLTIKLQPNESPTKQLSPKKSPTKDIRSPVLSPTKERSPVRSPLRECRPPVLLSTKESRSPVLSPPKELTSLLSGLQQSLIGLTRPGQQIIVEDVNKVDEYQKQSDVREDSAEDMTQKVIETIKEHKKEPILHQKNEKEEPKPVVVKEVTQPLVEQMVSKEDKKESKELPLNESKTIEKSEKRKSRWKEKEESKDSEIEKNVISSETTQQIKEQLNTSIQSSEKISPVLTQTVSEPQVKASEVKESVVQRLAEKTEKPIEREKKTIESEPKAEKAKPPRRRRWGGSVNSESQQNAPKGISSDQLKELIPDIDSTGGSGVDNSKVSKSETDSIVVTSSLSRTQTSVANNEMPPKRDIRVVRKSVSVPEDGQTISEETVKPSHLNVEQKNKIVVESEPKNDGKEEEEVKREVSPAVGLESNIIFIRNLVRPFTVPQLKDVLQKTGRLIDDRFWIDKIKSKCFATYDTVDEAVATRTALHGTRWPTSNPKQLSVDFATKEELDSQLNESIATNRDFTVRKTEENVLIQKYDITIKTDEQKNSLREKENRTENRPIREWDREKLQTKDDDNRRTANKRRPISPTPRGRSQERDNKRRRQDSTKPEERIRAADSTSAEVPTAEGAQESESPAKLLDDLFRKTIATPSIYWLPLTEEQIVVRDERKAEEEKKRTEERNAREEQFRKRQEDKRIVETSPSFRPERNQWRSDSPPNRRNFGRRPSPPFRRSPPGRRSPPPFRRRSPPIRYSRSRSRSPVNRRKR